MTLRVRNVTKAYEEAGRSHTVLEAASLDLAEGEFVAIRGRSGCGKTTLLNLVAGLDAASSGEIWLGDTCLSRLDPRARTLVRRRRMGFVFQFFNLIPTLTVLENVALQAELALGSGREARERARERLASVDMAGRADTFPDALSGGEQQRVAVARALVHEPELVLADEPTGNLDDASGGMVLDLLERFTRGAGRSLLLVTHSAQVSERSDRVLAVQDRRLVEAG